MKQENLTARPGIPVLQGREDVKTDEYLGDGIHASHDGWHIVLSTAQHGPIYLDPSVLRALIRYASRHGMVYHAPQEDGPSGQGCNS
jgi:hypothetical protein